MELYAAAYGADTMIPKFHFLVHTPGILRRFGFLPNTMALERKHKEVKRYGVAISNHNKTSRSTIREVTVHHLYVMDEAAHLDLSPGLINPHDAPAALYSELGLGNKEELKLSNVARFSQWEIAFKGDVVAVLVEAESNWTAGRVQYFLGRGDGNYCCLELLACQERSRTHSRWSGCGEVALVPLCNVRHVFVYKRAVDGAVLLHPYGL